VFGLGPYAFVCELGSVFGGTVGGEELYGFAFDLQA
jgi:hypothetical protein